MSVQAEAGKQVRMGSCDGMQDESVQRYYTGKSEMWGQMPYGLLKIESEAANDHELSRIVYKFAPTPALRRAALSAVRCKCSREFAAEKDSRPDLEKAVQMPAPVIDRCSASGIIPCARLAP